MEHRIDTDYTQGSHGGLRLLLPFLIIPIAFALMHAMARHSYALKGGHHREGWKNGVPPMFAELHRRAHAAEAEKPVEMTA